MCGVVKQYCTYPANEALFDYKITNVKGTVATPAKAEKAFASGTVDESVLDEESTDRLEDVGKERGSVDLGLGVKLSAWKRLIRSLSTCVMPVSSVQNAESVGLQDGRTRLLNSSTI